MPTKDRFTSNDPLTLFLSEHADGPEEQGIGKALDSASISSRILKASILAATATAIGIAILSVENPATLFAGVTASRIDNSALQPGTDQSTPTVQSTAMQSTADAQALPPTARDAPSVNPESAPPSDNKTAARNEPTRDEFAAASEPAAQSQTENTELPTEALFKQFQAWRAEEDRRAQVALVQLPQDARPEVGPTQKHRRVRPVQNARAKIRHAQKPRAKVQREQDGEVPARPVRDARAQDQSVQSAQAPSFLQIFDPFRASPPQRAP
ncbi:hypothetical protein NLM33_15460 [Bradyrhizobium sp. CCGUVB1N3]|uniref:hypothetical protein n=1 Tax=Bradyrhizobium sp. CCGUVB1N3 TaxID=2949629 RepID=UPI0020B2A778|nr:hypothetical protein [Bradyrhizobium sp. CCGUVB1N3]MCP3471720.1 hypothetical protein [Bradyrhizobium sp. CCGUVB1N3]